MRGGEGTEKGSEGELYWSVSCVKGSNRVGVILRDAKTWYMISSMSDRIMVFNLKS